jgi:hypothetical protein
MTGLRSASPRTLTLAALVLCAATSQVSAGSSWIVKGAGPRAFVEAASRVPGSKLHLACENGVSLYFYPPRGWNGATLSGVALVIDGERVVVTSDAVDRGLIVSDLPGEAVGTSPALRARFKRGRSLMIVGKPADAIAMGKLTFDLSGAMEAISEFERRCPATAKALVGTPRTPRS